MRLAILAILALAPLAVALPGACADPCVVASNGLSGYQPALVTLASGTSVVFTSSDYAHVTRDGTDTLELADRCFNVVHTPGSDSPAVRFDLVDGALFATVEGDTLACGRAAATPEGVVLAYYCTLHPTMRGALLVTAS